jgi:hypothetical protein
MRRRGTTKEVTAVDFLESSVFSGGTKLERHAMSSVLYRYAKPPVVFLCFYDNLMFLLTQLVGGLIIRPSEIIYNRLLCLKYFWWWKSEEILIGGS